MKAAVYAGTRNVYENMIPAMKSLLCNSDVDKIYFLIEDDAFPYQLPQEVECINVEKINKWFNKATCPNYHAYWSMMPLYRAAYAKIFPHLDRILSLDNDTIVDKNISNLWDIDFGNNYLAAVRDTPGLNKAWQGFYVNCGVLLHNLKKIREEKKDDAAIAWLNRERRDFSEQDVFNDLFKKHILELPTQYNSCQRFQNFDSNNRTIYHFAGDRNYINYDIVKKYKNCDIIRPNI